MATFLSEIVSQTVLVSHRKRICLSEVSFF